MENAYIADRKFVVGMNLVWKMDTFIQVFSFLNNECTKHGSSYLFVHVMDRLILLVFILISVTGSMNLVFFRARI